jgi:hypothetical protein
VVPHEWCQTLPRPLTLSQLPFPLETPVRKPPWKGAFLKALPVVQRLPLFDWTGALVTFGNALFRNDTRLRP